MLFTFQTRDLHPIGHRISLVYKIADVSFDFRGRNIFSLPPVRGVVLQHFQYTKKALNELLDTSKFDKPPAEAAHHDKQTAYLNVSPVRSLKKR